MNRWTLPIRSSLLPLIVFFVFPVHLSLAAGPQFVGFQTRRTELRKNLDGTIVLFGSRQISSHETFFQESNFYYLTGWNQAGVLLLISPFTEILFLPHHNERFERYNGRQVAPEDANVHEVTGFENVFPIEEFEFQLLKVMGTAAKVYALTSLMELPTAVEIPQLRSLVPLRDASDAGPLIGRLRAHKSASEIAAMQHAIDVAVEAHRAAWKRVVPGLFEYQIGATLMETFLDRGCERYAYSPDVGSGIDSTILDYRVGSVQIKPNDILLIDAAPECAHYKADITRTIPPSGKFTSRQREVYKVELGAQKAAIDAVRPGITMTELRKIAADYMDAHGKDLKGNPLGLYFTHGIGHHIGLDVTDPKLTDTLEVGNVITIEPGIYIPEEAIGVRIEDMVLVMEKGHKVLSAALPKETDEIEEALIK